MALFDQFDAWKPSDFEAFEQPKWRSNRFNVPRGQVRDRLKSLLEQALGRSGADWSGLELWTSRPEPNFFNNHEVRDQWALLVRPETERARIEVVQGAVTATRPQLHHAHLGVQIDAAGVRGWLRVPREASWDQPGWRTQTALLTMLAGVEPLHLELDGQRAAPEALQAAAADPAPREVGIVWAQSTEEALAGGGGLDDLAMWLSAALPVLQAILVAAPAAAASGPTATPQAAEAAATAPVAPPAPAAAATQPEARPWQRYRPPPVERKERPTQQGAAAAERLVPPALRAALERELREEEARRLAAEEARLRAAEEFRRREAAWQERQQQPRPGSQYGGGPSGGQGPAHGPMQRPASGADRAQQGASGRAGGPPAERGPQGWSQAWPRGGSSSGPHADAQGRKPDGPERWEGRPDSRPDPRRDAQQPRPAEGGHVRGRPYEVRDVAPTPAVTTLGPGAKVALTSGLFVGKTGTVSALHGDQAQVMLGLLSVRVPVASLRLQA